MGRNVFQDHRNQDCYSLLQGNHDDIFLPGLRSNSRNAYNSSNILNTFLVLFNSHNYSYGKMLFCIFVYEESEKSDRLSNNIPKAK